MRRLTLGLAALLLCCAVAIGRGRGEKPEPAKQLDGKELFKINCKSCHSAKSAHGEYTPMTYIGEQWERFDEKLAETDKAVVDRPAAPAAAEADDARGPEGNAQVVRRQRPTPNTHDLRLTAARHRRNDR